MKNSFLFALALLASLTFGSELDNLWDSALRASPSDQTGAWGLWLEAAKQQNISSASPHINLAASLWEEKKVAESVEQILLSAQNRLQPWATWSDFSIANEIQHALISQTSPLDSIGFRLSLIWNKNLFSIWACLVFWIFFSILYRRFGPSNLKSAQIPLLITLLIFFLLGFGLEVNKRLIKEPVLLKDSSGLIPVFKEAKVDDSQKITELPAGLLVYSQSTKDRFFKIDEPVPGWIESTMAVNFPRPQS